MSVITKELSFQTRGNNDIIDLTDHIQESLVTTGLTSGIVTVFVPGSTAGITTIEYEPGVIHDVKKMVNELIPQGHGWQHDRIDNNAHSHLRAAIIGPSLTVPFVNGQLVHGTWQQIVFIDFDVHPRHRKVVLQFIGE